MARRSDSLEHGIETFRSAFDHAAIPIAVTDPRGILLHVNAAFEELTGFTALELLGKTPRMIRSGAHPPEFYRQFWKTIAGGDRWNGVVLDRRKSGEMFESELTVVPVKDPSGKVCRFVATHREITQYRRIESELRHRLHTSSEMFHGLAAILARVTEGLQQSIFSLAWTGPVPGSGDPAHADHIFRSIHTDLADLRTLARLVESSSVPEVLDLRSVLCQALRASGDPTLMKRRIVSDRLTGRVRGDPVLLHDLFRNLTDRVIVPAGVTRLKTSCTVLPDQRVSLRLKASCRRDPDRESSSSSIDPSVIGLEMARAILAGMGGELRLERERDGLKLELLFPGLPTGDHSLETHASEAGGKGMEVEASHPPAHPALSMLLLVGNPDLIKTLQPYIRSVGDREWRVHRGHEVPVILDDLRARLHQLVLMDLDSCPTDPFKLIRDMNRISPRLPIIVFSERGGERLAVELIKAGATEFLTRDERWLWSLPRVVAAAVESQRSAMELDQLKTDFVGMVSHDLKNPLLAILGYANMLIESQHEASISPEVRRWIGRIRDNSLFGLELIGDHLDTIQLDSRSMQLLAGRHDVAEMIEEGLDRNRYQANEKGVRLLAAGRKRKIMLRCDRGKILQVLNNLLSNAIKFSSPESCVEIRAGQRGEWVTLSVRDEGRGIAPSELPLLFKKFSRTSTRPTGGEKSTGLGLYIVSEIVKLHGGSISVESKPGKGSRFTVRLPGGSGPRT